MLLTNSPLSGYTSIYTVVEAMQFSRQEAAGGAAAAPPGPPGVAGGFNPYGQPAQPGYVGGQPGPQQAPPAPLQQGPQQAPDAAAPFGNNLDGNFPPANGGADVGGPIQPFPPPAANGGGENDVWTCCCNITTLEGHACFKTGEYGCLGGLIGGGVGCCWGCIATLDTAGSVMAAVCPYIGGGVATGAVIGVGSVWSCYACAKSDKCCCDCRYCGREMLLHRWGSGSGAGAAAAIAGGNAAIIAAVL